MSKNNSRQRQLQKMSLVTLAIALSLTATASLAAGPLDLSDNALEVVIGVEPNIMILTDDSGSMDLSIMTTEDDGGAHLGTWNYGYTHPDPGSPGSSSTKPATNYYDWSSTSLWADPWHGVVPTQEFLLSKGLAAPQGGVWRYWNSSYNTIYYNPDVTYTPWGGLDVNGDAFTNITTTDAPYDPYRPGNGTLDLTSTISYDTDCGLTGCQSNSDLDGEGNTITVTGFYPARYYEWTDDNADEIVDASETHTLVEIKSGSTYSGRTAYNASSGEGRSDCGADVGDGTVTCSDAQELQNFANWFSYYRKRDLVAKAAFSKSIDPAETARIGYATINNNASNSIGVTSMNISSSSGNKKTLLDSLFATLPNSGTPLRQALRNTGRYFTCSGTDTDILGSSTNKSPGDSGCPVEISPAGQCQQNYAILMTDGFWNGSDPEILNSGGASSSSNNIDDDGGDFAGGAFSDSYYDTLADVAMYYYKTDLHTLSDDVPTTSRDIARYLGSTSPFETMIQHMTTYTVGFGVDGTLTADPSDPATAASCRL